MLALGHGAFHLRGTPRPTVTCWAVQTGRCDPARPEDIGREVGVTVSYRVDLPFPILFDGVSQLRARAVMRCGG